MSFDPKILEGILVCTKCHASLVRDAESLICTGSECRMKFSIRDEIPDMLLEDAVALPAAEWGPVMQRTGRDPTTGARPAR